MKQEWPVTAKAADADQPLLPLAMHEHVQLVKATPTVSAFCERRAAQMLPPFNHTAEDDLAEPVDHLIRKARDRLNDILSITGHGLMNFPPARREMLLRKLEVAGGLLVAAHQRCSAEIPEQEGN